MMLVIFPTPELQIAGDHPTAMSHLQVVKQAGFEGGGTINGINGLAVGLLVATCRQTFLTLQLGAT